jgi:hypothetical protein
LDVLCSTFVNFQLSTANFQPSTARCPPFDVGRWTFDVRRFLTSNLQRFIQRQTR